jgi:hypothetical protein
MPYLSLSYGLEFLTSTMSGDYFRMNCGGPSNWFLHTHPDPDFIQKIGNDKVKIVKPMITIPYNDELYLYVFYITSVGVISIITAKIYFFESLGYKIYRIDEKSFVVLTNDELDNYDGDLESIIDESGDIIEDDIVGGSISFSRIQ